ncbi:MAG: hypothetical protein K9M75_03690 [Phycisphaerae bacterium]|nr:hypothetical protein [Phycisphaerae bacterium]
MKGLATKARRVISTVLVLIALVLSADYFGLLGPEGDGAFIVRYTFIFVDSTDSSFVNDVEIDAEYEGKVVGRQTLLQKPDSAVFVISQPCGFPVILSNRFI